MIFILVFLLIFFPSFNAMVIGHHRYNYLQATVIMDQKNRFDGHYLAYTGGNSQTFPYNSKQICVVHKNSDSEIAISLESAYTFHKSAPKKMPIAKDAKIVACLEYKGHSILIYQQQGETHWLRSGNEKILQFQRKIERFSFDHFLATLYAQIDGTIYRMDLQQIVDNFWLTANQSEQQNETRLLIEPIKHLPPNLVDFIIANNALYWLESDSIYKSALNLNEKHFVSKIGAKQFRFIPFPMETFNKTFPQFLLAKNEHMIEQWFIFYFALLKACILAFLLWYYRKPMANGIRKRFKKTSSSNSEEQEQYCLAGGIYPSTPLFIPKSSQI